MNQFPLAEMTVSAKKSKDSVYVYLFKAISQSVPSQICEAICPISYVSEGIILKW